MRKILLAFLFLTSGACVASATKEQTLTEVEMTRYWHFPTADTGYPIKPKYCLIVRADGLATLIKSNKNGTTYDCFGGRHNGRLYRLISLEAKHQADNKIEPSPTFTFELDTRYSFRWGNKVLSSRTMSAKQSAASKRIDELMFALREQIKWKSIADVPRYERDFTGLTVITERLMNYWGTPPEELGSPYLDGIAVSISSVEKQPVAFRTITHDNGHSTLRVPSGKYKVVFGDYVWSAPDKIIFAGGSHLIHIQPYAWPSIQRTYERLVSED